MRLGVGCPQSLPLIPSESLSLLNDNDFAGDIRHQCSLAHGAARRAGLPCKLEQNNY